MYVVIDAALKNPQDIMFLAKRLQGLEQLPDESIPATVSTLALKHAVLPALADADWQEIKRVAKAWDTPAKNRLAQYLEMDFAFKFGKSYLYSKVKYKLYRKNLSSKSKDFVKHLDELKVSPEAINQQIYSIQDLWVNTDKLSSKKTKHEFISAILGKKEKEQWQNRAKQLGVWDFDSAWEQIQQSVRLLPCFTSETSALDERDYIKIDQIMRSIHYSRQAIIRNVAEKKFKSSVDKFSDWFNLMMYLEELNSYPEQKQAAFDSICNDLWNWIAQLWNVERELCLVHFISKYCTPYALHGGNTEFHRLLTGITDGNFR